MKGYFSLVLHSHLPYVLGHGRWPHGTDWLNEAAAETYIPILNVINELASEGIPAKITIGISPVLCEQLRHQNFVEEFSGYLQQKITAAQEDYIQFKKFDQKEYQPLAEMWQQYYAGIKDSFERYNRDLISEFKILQDAGNIEIITCAATHGYLPLLSQDTSCQAQIKAAVYNYEKLFGRRPRGIWLPECAYRPAYNWSPPVEIEGVKGPYHRKGIEEFLSENGLEYFIVDTATLKGGKAIGVYIDRFEALRTLWGQFEKEFKPRDIEPEKTPQEIYLVGSREGRAPVAVFTRDPETGLQVWSGEWGYPGDGNYLDFHKKRFPGGHRYWRVTSAKADLALKEIYDPVIASSRVPENAAHFAGMIKRILLDYHRANGHAGIICAPYDAELYGHWWFEGPRFIKQVIKNLHHDPDIAAMTCSEYDDLARPLKVISLPEGSWGEGGYHYIWLNENNSWTWKHIYQYEIQMQKIADKCLESDNSELMEIGKQAARELMLLSASDWQFLISTWSARDYAEMRLATHFGNFDRLAKMVDEFSGKLSKADTEFLHELQYQDDLFAEIKLEWFAAVEFP
jgi:1,4-alpha-glucan branching enzyme